jgi:hypothetical protein
MALNRSELHSTAPASMQVIAESRVSGLPFIDERLHHLLGGTSDAGVISLKS